jgi:hypothetical protein
MLPPLRDSIKSKPRQLARPLAGTAGDEYTAFVEERYRRPR